MRLILTCFKPSGKYYAERESDIPELNTWELSSYIEAHPETWPTTSLKHYSVLVQPDPEGHGVPILIPHSSEDIAVQNAVALMERAIEQTGDIAMSSQLEKGARALYQAGIIK